MRMMTMVKKQSWFNSNAYLKLLKIINWKICVELSSYDDFICVFFLEFLYGTLQNSQLLTN